MVIFKILFHLLSTHHENDYLDSTASHRLFVCCCLVSNVSVILFFLRFWIRGFRVRNSSSCVWGCVFLKNFVKLIIKWNHIIKKNQGRQRKKSFHNHFDCCFKCCKNSKYEKDPSNRSSIICWTKICLDLASSRIICNGAG